MSACYVIAATEDDKKDTVRILTGNTIHANHVEAKLIASRSRVWDSRNFLLMNVQAMRLESCRGVQLLVAGAALEVLVFLQAW
jgi:hypothetical protein